MRLLEMTFAGRYRLDELDVERSVEQGRDRDNRSGGRHRPCEAPGSHGRRPSPARGGVHASGPG